TGVNISADNSHSFTRQADQPFDVILNGVARKLENDDVPTLGLCQVVAEFANNDPIAAERALIGTLDWTQRLRVATNGTSPRDNMQGRELVIVLFSTAADLVLSSTLGTPQVLVPAVEGRRH